MAVRSHGIERCLRRSHVRRRTGLLAALLLGLLLVGCTPRQEGEELVDVEPDRLINTDLSVPKNPQRWAYVTSRVVTDPSDLFPGYRVVLANPFSARLLEERRTARRGVKLAQYVYDVQTTEKGIEPGALRRVNVMVQDPDRYAETDGWGYASFDGNGAAIPVDAAADCMTCHTSGPITPFSAVRRAR